MSKQSEPLSLKRVLKPLHLWALAVGLVISGEYFGWNYGWQAAGTLGFLVATAIATALYICFIFSFTELSTRIPHAGGPFAFAYKAFGPIGGLLAGYATLVEFIFAPPAVAFALGSYVHFLHPGIPVIGTAISCYAVFTVINMIGIRESATFNLVITVLAVLELLVFIGVLAPHTRLENFTAHNEPVSMARVFSALPFAIWFYLGIEGVAMVAEEVRDPRRNIPLGYGWGLATLVLLALAVMYVAGAIGDWRQLSSIDYPLPESIGMVMGKDNRLTQLFAGIGLFGLIASFHGLIIGYSRQLFALSRSGFLPAFLSAVNRRFRTPHWSLIAGGVIGIITLFTGSTDQIIILSAMGAVFMYAFSMLSLFRLRRQVQTGASVYLTPAYPWFPLIALILSLICLLAICWYNPLLAGLFFGALVPIGGIFYFTGMHKRSFAIVLPPDES